MINLKVDLSKFTKAMKLAETEVDKIPKKALDFFIQETPVRSGNARRNTRLSSKTIQANYAYAERLDKGWSNQSPNGMVDPTIKHIEKVLVPNAVRKATNG